MYKLYMDESGHSGELLNWSKDLNQPIFSLCGILVNNDRLERVNYELKELFCINSNEEIKSINEKYNYSFITDIFNVIKKYDIKIVGEIIEKKYYYSGRIVDTIIKSSYHYMLTNDLLTREELLDYIIINDYYIVNRLAELIYENIDYEMMLLYSEILVHKKLESIILLIEKIINLDSQKIAKCHKGLINRCLSSFGEYIRKIEKERSEEFVNFFILKSDIIRGKKKREIFISPHISSLEALKSRVKMKVDEEIEFYHDEQKEYSKILKDYFNIFEQHELKLEFIDSKDNYLIQVADIFAGILMKYTKELYNKYKQRKYKELYIREIKDTKILDYIDVNIVAKSNFILEYKNNLSRNQGVHKFNNDRFILDLYKSMDEIGENYNILYKNL